MEINEKYSYKNFSGMSFLDRPAEEFSNTIIKNSSFGQQSITGKKNVFRNDVENVTFEGCNLDNVHLPKNSTLIKCCNRTIMPQPDGEDWEVDESWNPVKPVLEKSFKLKGWSTDPKDIKNGKKRKPFFKALKIKKGA